MLGLKIGNYKITAAIGEGGMGAVYRAVHETLGRSAAVKVLLPEISNSRDMVARFFNEARSAASIQHPGIVEAYDFGFLPDGRAYIIMEFLDGESLASRLRRPQRMPHARALQIIRSVARALHAAHERGIVHRDIKPDNIFIVPDPEMPTGERIKLLDFGIAKLGPSGGEASLTHTGAVMGTPTYMAPEQCRGAGAVDRRADLYALGCLLYEMLCGRPPFVAEGAGDLIARHLYFQPEPPRSHDASIAPAIEALVMALLQKDPAHRPPTALALVEAIERLGVPAGGAPMPLGAPPAAPVTPTVTTLSNAAGAVGTDAGSPSRRRSKLVVASALAVVAMIVIAVMAMGGERDAGDGAGKAPQSDAPPAPPDVAVVAVVDATSAPPQPVDAVIAAAPADAVETPPMPDAPEPPAPVVAKPKRERAPGKQPVRTDRPPPIPPPPPPEVKSTCTRGSFASVLQAKQPDEATVQAALARLKKCQKELAPDVYADLQQQLISKL